MTSDPCRTPAPPPDADAVEQAFCEDADIYAEVRAETAAKLGRNDGAREWKKVGVEIEGK